MKNSTKNMMIAAAALVVAAGTAKAQSITAEVPFSFRAGGVLMPAGEYRVVPSGPSIFNLKNVDAHRSIFTMSYASNSAPLGDAKLTFECSGAECALVQMAPGSGLTYKFNHPSWGKNEDTRIAVIRAVLVKGR